MKKAFKIIGASILVIAIIIIWYNVVSIVEIPEVENTIGTKILQPKTITITEIVSDTTAEKKLRQQISRLSYKLLQLQRVKDDTVWTWQEGQVIIDEPMTIPDLWNGNIIEPIELQYQTLFEDRKIDKYSNLKVLTYSISLVDSIKISGVINYNKFLKDQTNKFENKRFWDDVKLFGYGVGTGVIIYVLIRS